MKNIHDLKMGDLEECAELFIKTFNEAPWNEKWSLATASKRLVDSYRSPGFKGLTYIEGGKVVGAVLGNREQWYDGEHFYVKEFFVDSSIQGKGIGKKLLENLEEVLREDGISLIHFWTIKGGAAESFYKKMGYKIPEDLTLMNKTFK